MRCTPGTFPVDGARYIDDLLLTVPSIMNVRRNPHLSATDTEHFRTFGAAFSDPGSREPCSGSRPDPMLPR